MDITKIVGGRKKAGSEAECRRAFGFCAIGMSGEIWVPLIPGLEEFAFL